VIQRSVASPAARLAHGADARLSPAALAATIVRCGRGGAEAYPSVGNVRVTRWASTVAQPHATVSPGTITRA
jgi:hypothetical protein